MSVNLLSDPVSNDVFETLALSATQDLEDETPTLIRPATLLRLLSEIKALRAKIATPQQLTDEEREVLRLHVQWLQTAEPLARDVCSILGKLYGGTQ